MGNIPLEDLSFERVPEQEIPDDLQQLNVEGEGTGRESSVIDRAKTRLSSMLAHKCPECKSMDYDRTFLLKDKEMPISTLPITGSTIPHDLYVGPLFQYTCKKCSNQWVE